MAPETVPEDLKRFILTSIPSIPFLEALLLLKTAPRDWSLEEIARRLYLSDKSTADALAGLCAAGMVSAHGSAYRFDPRSEELGQMIERLAALYARDLISVTALVHSQLDRNAQVFADAFKWRKDS